MITVKQQDGRGNHTLFMMLLALIMFSGISYADFIRSNGVVKDNKTGLHWQDDYSDNGNSIKFTTWVAAIEYCETLSLDGGGWRLPNKKELLSIVDYGRDNLSIDTVFLNTANTDSNYYWSSTTYAGDTDNAWAVVFDYGGTPNYSKSYDCYVRCVR